MKTLTRTVQFLNFEGYINMVQAEINGEVKTVSSEEAILISSK